MVKIISNPFDEQLIVKISSLNENFTDVVSDVLQTVKAADGNDEELGNYSVYSCKIKGKRCEVIAAKNVTTITYNGFTNFIHHKKGVMQKAQIFAKDGKVFADVDGENVALDGPLVTTLDDGIPVKVHCSSCDMDCMTRVESKTGKAGWCIAAACCLTVIGCFGCCLIPLKMRRFQIHKHFCVVCNTFVGKGKGHSVDSLCFKE